MDDLSDDDEPKSCVIQQRWVVVSLSFLALTHCFFTRPVMATVMQLLIEPKTANASRTFTLVCRNITSTTQIEPYKDSRGTDYGWTEADSENIEYWMNFSYVVTNFIGGYVSDMFGGKQVVQFSIVSSSILCFTNTILINQTNGNLAIVTLSCILLGGCQGVILPAVSSINAHWIPERERALLCTVAAMGIFGGVILHHLCTEHMIRSNKNWAMPFYVYGAVGLGLAVIWWIFASSNPHQDKRIRAIEKFYLDVEMGDSVDHRRKTVPLRKILLSVRVWAYVLGGIGYQWFWKLSSVFTAVYIAEVLNIDVEKRDIWNFMPYLMMLASGIVCGILSDLTINRGYINKEASRKVLTNIATMGPAIFMLAGSFAKCHAHVVETLFMISMALEGFIFSGIRLICMDLAPNYAGTLMGIENGMGTLGGLVIGFVMHKIAPNKNMIHYRKMFWYTLVLCAISNLIFVIFGNTTLQKFNTPERIKRRKRKQSRN